MTPRHLFIATVLVSMVNGVLSPNTFIVAYLAPLWMPAWVPPSAAASVYGASLLVSSATLLLSGVPAAVYERLTARPTSDVTSAAIWLAGALFLSLPGLARLV